MLSAEHIYKNYFDQVYRFALSRTSSTQDAQDVVSRVFVKVVEHLEDFKPRVGATERSWVFSILRNELIDFYRRQKPVSNLDAALEHGIAPNWNEDLDQNEGLKEVLACIGTLPDRQRELILLKYQSELQNKEIAELLHLEVSTVSAHLSRAIKTLRSQLPSFL